MSRSDRPVAPVATGEFGGWAGIAAEGIGGGVPEEFAAGAVGDIDEVAGDGGAAADDFAGDGFGAAADGLEEVVHVIGAAVESGGGVLEEVLFSGHVGAFHIHVRGFGVGDLAIEDDFELAAVDFDFAGFAEEVGSEALVEVLDGDAVGVGEGTALHFAVLALLEEIGAAVGRGDFEGAGVVCSEAPVGDVEVVGTPVGDHASAVFCVHAPIREVVMDAARGEGGIVGTERGWAEPAVPVEPVFHGFFGKVAGKRRGAELDFGADEFSDDAVADEFAGDAEFATGALHGTGLEDALVVADRLHDGDGFLDVVGEGFFAVDVLAGAEGGDGDDGVPVIRGGDADRVDVLAGDDFAEVCGIGAALPCGVLAGRIVFFDLAPGVAAAGCIDIADGHDLNAGLTEESAEEVAALFPHADEAHGDLAGGGITAGRCAESGWKQKRNAEGRRAEKGSAAGFHGDFPGSWRVREGEGKTNLAPECGVTADRNGGG